MLQTVNGAVVVNRLRDRVRSAKVLCDEAFLVFEDALKPTSSLPLSDGAYQITKASEKYRTALAKMNKATADLNAFLIHGTMPPEGGDAG